MMGIGVVNLKGNKSDYENKTKGSEYHACHTMNTA